MLILWLHTYISELSHINKRKKTIINDTIDALIKLALDASVKITASYAFSLNCRVLTISLELWNKMY